VVALLKGPDKDRCEPSSYRGICLLPVFGKVLETIMVDRVREVLSEDCRWQFGFSPRTLCGGCLDAREEQYSRQPGEIRARHFRGL